MEDMLHIAVFSTKPYDKQFLEKVNTEFGHEIAYFEPRLTRETATLADGFEVVCVFVNDQLDRQTLELLAQGGTRLIALRCAGFNNVDLAAAGDLGMTVVRVPAYSPHAVAEHTLGLILTLNRKIHRAHNRVRESNFALEGLLGFDLHGQTVGIIGIGQIGQVVARILTGFGCKVLAFDPYPDETLTALGLRYVELPQLLSDSDIITLHCPLTPQTRHIVNPDTLAQMKPGVMLINTSRGALLDTVAVIEALKSGKVAYLGLDVYEEEADLFFEDLSDEVIQDDVFMRLLTFPNVLITAHQAFFTRDALMQIAQTTMHNINAFRNKQPLKNEVTAKLVKQ
jgi:D-lactate dehydrogenase